MRKRSMPDEGKFIPVFKNLGFSPVRQIGEEFYGDCIFCGRANKMYVNHLTGQWNCKSGHCALQGNLYTFFDKWYAQQKAFSMESEQRSHWERLAENRQMSIGALKRGGLVFDGYRWWIPVRNGTGNIVTFRYYRAGIKLRALGCVDVGIYNLDALVASNEARDGKIVIICEGEWDAIALIDFFRRHGIENYVVVGIPGAGTFKQEWIQYFQHRKLIAAYDNDIDGQKGVWRISEKMAGTERWLKQIVWDTAFPDHYDIRDFVTNPAATPAVFNELIGDMVPQPDRPVQAQHADVETFPALYDPSRPSFDEVLEVFHRWLYMSEDMVNALRITFATVITQQIDGIPLWMHIAGAPGCGKTEILRAADACRTCFMASTVTPASLVSGWNAGGDASLIPRLNNMTFLLKDFTEILRAERNEKNAIYNILRGAFDGYVYKPFGNGVTREYWVKFNLVTGVTKSVYADQNTMLGERFLIYHMRNDEDATDDLLAMALGNGGHESTMENELAEISRRFLEVKLEPTDVPELPQWVITRLIALTQVVAMLRASVEKDVYRDRLLYRPEYEIGTRPGKQLKKLIQGLALLHPDEGVTVEDYKIALQVGICSCIGFNLDLVREMVHEKNGILGQDLAERCDIPYTTLRDQIDDLCNLGVLTRKPSEPNGEKGRPPLLYQIKPRLRKLWITAGFDEYLSGEEFKEIASAVYEAGLERRKRRPGTEKFPETLDEILEPSIKATTRPVQRTDGKRRRTIPRRAAAAA